MKTFNSKNPVKQKNMFDKLTHNLTISAAKSLLKTDGPTELSPGRRLISIVAGAYIFQRGIRTLSKRPFLGLQEAFLGGLLLYNGASGIKNSINRKPKKVSEVRRNQIQGNDPKTGVPAFV
jgi:hypothetical protein